ncbi:MAG: repair protein RecO [Thermoleophilia bacterium]|nr:repair protein RecO [Thermoleophilia bacterium]
MVLRTLRYGEADVIAHLLTRTAGRRGVIVKGARSPRSRIGARLEPFLAVSVQLIEGRGDLAVVRSVDVTASHEHLRGDWRAQRSGAVALDLVSRLTEEHQPSEQAYHLVRNYLAALDTVAARTGFEPDAAEQRGGSLLAAFELKLLHVNGMAPQLGLCVRCGEPVDQRIAFSATDGGVVCSTCRTAGDAPLTAAEHALAVTLMRDPLAAVATRESELLPTLRELRTVEQQLVAAMSAEHAGVRPRRS